MSDPIVFISHNRVKEGKLDDLRQVSREGVKLIEADKLGTLVQLAYVNEDGTEVTFVHLFPNADAMDLHMQGASERAKRAYEFIESDRFEIYGTPSHGVMEMMKKIAGSGVVLSVNPQHLGGFIRLKSR
jgi:quinol monooxygenase YgiN